MIVPAIPALWTSVDAPYPAALTNRLESACLFLHVEAAAIDRIAVALRAFVPGIANGAELQGLLR